MKILKKDEAFLKLKDYNGINPYILKLKKRIYGSHDTSAMTDFAVEYINTNHSFTPMSINRMTTVADWYSNILKDELGIDFSPTKLKIISFLGETKKIYHCYAKYRQSADPIEVFLPKKAVIKNFFVEDYTNTTVDFDRYDRLSSEKDPNRKLKEHQKEAIKFLLSRKKCILADDQGLGKTTSLAVASIEGNFDSIVIICPASLKLNWSKELQWYINEKDITVVESLNQKTKGELEQFLGYSIGKSNKKRDELIEEALENGKWQDNRIVIVNYDILDEFYSFPVTNSKTNIDDAFRKSPILQYIKNRKSLIIIDEAHKLSNRTSNRYKIIKDLIKRGCPDSLYLATGTPITNNPENLFCILQLLDDPIKDDWEFYAKRYCNSMKIPAKGEKAKWTDIFLRKKHKRTWFDLTSKEKDELKEFINDNARKITITNGHSNLEELKERISHIYIRRVKDELDGMVNKTIHEAYYDLTPEQEIEYNRLWDEYEALKKEENPDKELNKELLEGAVYRKYISNIMIPYTIRIVDHWLKKGEKVVIACCYDEELYTLRDHYKDCCVIFNGKINSKQKNDAIQRFMNDESTTVFIGNINAAGVGITLTSANKLVFNNMSFVPGDNQQMEDRICRIGQKKDCDIYYQIFRDTQYQKMWETVLNKGNVINQIIKRENEK